MEDEKSPRRPDNYAAEELNARLAAAALPPARADDTPVLMGQSGPRRRATPEELRAFLAREVQRQAAESCGDPY